MSGDRSIQLIDIIDKKTLGKIAKQGLNLMKANKNAEIRE
jgi:hypothetical protein